MKKIMISLLMVAATFNAMAITYTGKVKVRLTSSDNQYCEAVVATSDDLNDGLNNSYYAPFNDENKEVHLYVEYSGTRYAHFGSSASTMRNMPLIMKANSATDYTLSFSAMVGTIEIYDTKAGANIDKSQAYNFSIEASERDADDVVANRFIINYNPYEVTLNGEGLATFSVDKSVVIPDGLKAYRAEYVSMSDELTLNALTSYIPANTGVILYGTANANYALPKATVAVPALTENNDLVPASAWAYPHAGYDIFVLNGSALYLYEGENMKANKAYLSLPASAGAPRRIRLVFDQATGVENIAAEGKAVKFIENGRVFIKRGDKVYNLQGQLVK